MKTLDEQEAKEWIDTRWDERSPFYGFENITEEAAKIIVTQKRTPLGLPCLKELSPSIAQILATYKGECLDLQSMETITPESAKILAQGKYDTLWLKGIEALPGDALQELANFEGVLDLSGLQNLPKCNPPALRGFRGAGLDLSSLETLPSEDRKTLPTFNGWLDLSGLTDLSAEAAKELSRHDGELLLNGLTELADSTAQALSDFGDNCRASDDGPTLSLNSVTHLSDVAISNLSKVRANLSLHGLEELSENGAGELANHRGALDMELIEASCHDEPTLDGDLGCCPIPQKGIKLLSKHNGPINGVDPKQWALENALYIDLYESRKEVRAEVGKHDNQIDEGLMKMINGADKDLAELLFEDFSEANWAAVLT